MNRDIESLQGEWQPISVVVDGSPVAAHLFEGALLVISENRFSLHNPLPDAEQRMEGTFKVDRAKLPKWLTLTLDGGSVVEEIYELDNDILSVCYPTKQRNRPSNFDSTAGSGLSVVVYKRRASN